MFLGLLDLYVLNRKFWPRIQIWRPTKPSESQFQTEYFWNSTLYSDSATKKLLRNGFTKKLNVRKNIWFKGLIIVIVMVEWIGNILLLTINQEKSGKHSAASIMYLKLSSYSFMRIVNGVCQFLTVISEIWVILITISMKKQETKV